MFLLPTITHVHSKNEQFIRLAFTFLFVFPYISHDKVESIYMFLFMYRRCLNQQCEAVCFTFIHILLLSIFLLPFSCSFSLPSLLPTPSALSPLFLLPPYTHVITCSRFLQDMGCVPGGTIRDPRELLLTAQPSGAGMEGGPGGEGCNP